MAHETNWIERTIEAFVLPAVAPAADVCAAGAARCTCGHGVLAHVAGVCRSCDCAAFDPAVTTAA